VFKKVFDVLTGQDKGGTVTRWTKDAIGRVVSCVAEYTDEE